MDEKQKMVARKDGRYIVFEFEDGKSVKYDLATGKTFGKSGKEVKSISSQLSGYDLLSTIEAFEDKRYRNFLKFLDKNFINRSKANEGCGWSYRQSNRRVNRYTNIGSFLSHVQEYSMFEQYFSAGIEKIDVDFTRKINEVPKGLLKIVREKGIELDEKLYQTYIARPDDVAWALTYEFTSISTQEVMYIIVERSSRGVYYLTRTQKFEELLNWGWQYRSTLLYIDRLMTLEALSYAIIDEIYDYAQMMRKITPRYEKYPRNFLTTHKIAVRNYNRLKEQFDEELFEKIREDSKWMEYSDDKYIMLYPNKTSEIKEEGVRQNHCVASYIKNVMDGYCHIMFMRGKENKDEALVTIEVRGQKVVQARGKYNRDCTTEENQFIKKFENYLTRKAGKNNDD